MSTTPKTVCRPSTLSGNTTNFNTVPKHICPIHGGNHLTCVECRDPLDSKNFYAFIAPEHRLEAYIYCMLEYLEGSNENGVCYDLVSWMQYRFSPHAFEGIFLFELFPEFFRQEPDPEMKEAKGWLWWPVGSPKRLEALEKAIMQTAKLLEC